MYTSYYVVRMRMRRKHLGPGVQLVGMANKNTVLATLVDYTNNFFLTISKVFMCLRVTQMTRSRDLVIFMLDDDGQTNQLLLRMCTQGKKE